MTSGKTLVFFTSTYPFGKGETFIESEMPFLLSAFDNIIIVSANITDQQTRQTPPQVELIRLPYHVSTKYKLRALLATYKSDIRSEVTFIQRRLKLPLSYKVLATLYSCYGKALEISGWLEMFCAERKLEKQNLYLYSYWLNNTAAGLALFKEQNPQVKVFCRAHRWDVYFWWHKLPYLPLRSFILNRLDACFCIAKDGKTYLEQLPFARTKNNLILSPLGTFNNTNVTADFNRNKLALISCSNVIPMKRVSLIVEALSLISNISIEWKHFGSGELLEQTKSLAQKLLDHKNNINYCFMGHVANVEMLKHYKTSAVDLFINVSNSEGVPVSIMEACSFGVPVVATNVGGNGEIVCNEQNGFLLNENVSAQDIAEVIVKFTEMSAEEKIRMRSSAQQTWQQNYNAETNYRHFVQQIKSL